MQYIKMTLTKTEQKSLHTLCTMYGYHACESKKEIENSYGFIVNIGIMHYSYAGRLAKYLPNLLFDFIKCQNTNEFTKAQLNSFLRDDCFNFHYHAIDFINRFLSHEYDKNDDSLDNIYNMIVNTSHFKNAMYTPNDDFNGVAEFIEKLISQCVDLLIYTSLGIYKMYDDINNRDSDDIIITKKRRHNDYRDPKLFLKNIIKNLPKFSKELLSFNDKINSELSFSKAELAKGDLVKEVLSIINSLYDTFSLSYYIKILQVFYNYYYYNDDLSDKDELGIIYNKTIQLINQIYTSCTVLSRISADKVAGGIVSRVHYQMKRNMSAKYPTLEDYQHAVIEYLKRPCNICYRDEKSDLEQYCKIFSAEGFATICTIVAAKLYLEDGYHHSLNKLCRNISHKKYSIMASAADYFWTSSYNDFSKRYFFNSKLAKEYYQILKEEY